MKRTPRLPRRLLLAAALLLPLLFLLRRLLVGVVLLDETAGAPPNKSASWSLHVSGEIYPYMESFCKILVKRVP